MYELRSYQQEAVDSAMNHMRKSTEHALIQAAGGSGKSLIVAEFAKQIFKLSGGKRVLCLQPSKELTEQNYEKYMMTGEKASIYSASISKSLRHPVIYATPGTFKRVAKRLGSEFAAVTIDECFDKDTLITTRNGYFKISDPRLSEQEIMCFDEEKGSIAFDKPVKVWQNDTKNISRLIHSKGEVKCTSTHKFYIEGLWVKAEEIKAGQKMLLEDSQANVLKKLLRAIVAVVKKLCRM